MPFKVVQTIEGKKYKLFTVPSGWEKDNILRYPSKCISKFIKDENSTPTLHWDIIKCKVKRNDVLSYENGEKLVSEMLKHSDTEDEVQYCTQQRRPQNKKSLNLNSVAQDMMGNIVSTNNTDLASTSVGMPTVINNNEPDIEETILTNTSHTLLNDKVFEPLEEDSVSFDINKMFQNQKNILDNQATIVSQILQIQQQQLDNNAAIMAQFQCFTNVQNNLIQKVSALSVQLEDAVSQIVMTSPNQDMLSLSSSKGHIDNIPINYKPVDNARELDELERQLSDPVNRDRLKNSFSILCSGGKATDCAYMLADVMFSRKFICDCSWSGGSRGEEVKVPLKGYKHVLSFFWNLVHSWDDKYSLKDNEKFFKMILKNAKKRKMAKLERASTSRCSKPKRVKLTGDNSKNKENDYDDSKNEEENATDYEEINDLIEKNTEENEEGDNSVEQNMEENKERNDTVEENTEENKKSDVPVKENTKKNKKRDDLVQQKIGKTKEWNNSVEQHTKKNKKREDFVQQKIEKNKERNNSVEENTKENKKRNDLVKETTEENAVRMETSV